MIHLFTGVPGSGKTLYAVWWLEKQLQTGRRLVVNGVKGLVLDHEMVDDDWVRDWHNRAQANDIVVVDEVQRIWPQVSVGVKASPDIEALHVHRHMGVDFVVITQHPNRMNKVIRDLCGHHVHVRRLFGLKQAMLYEWDSVHNPNAGFRDAVKTRWSYPRRVFELYVSAEVHTKQKGTIPKALFVIPVALALAIYLGWRGLHGVAGFGSMPKPGVDAPVGASAAAGGAIDAKTVASPQWRVAGQYVVAGTAYVLLVDKLGRFRSELVGGFNGRGVKIEGVVDGQRVADWSGGGAIDTAGVAK